MSNAAPRSYLFVPGDRPERFGKALTTNADRVIIDLEDAVAPDRKDAARQFVENWLSTDRPVVLRINAPDTPWFARDLALAKHPGVAAVMLPKTERPEHAEALGSQAVVIALIETAVGFANVRSIALAGNVRRLAFGGIDFQLDMGMRATFDDLVHFRSEIVLASRLANLPPPIDSPSVALDNSGDVEWEAQRARRLGFGAKLCIHPRQVDVVNWSFSPTEAELSWARRVVEISEASRGAAVALDGKMVDRPVLLRAQAILSESRPEKPAAVDRLHPI